MANEVCTTREGALKRLAEWQPETDRDCRAFSTSIFSETKIVDINSANSLNCCIMATTGQGWHIYSLNWDDLHNDIEIEQITDEPICYREALKEIKTYEADERLYSMEMVATGSAPGARISFLRSALVRVAMDDKELSERHYTSIKRSNPDHPLRLVYAR